MNRPLHYIKVWLWSGLIVVCAMVIIGGITRLTGSGLSIVEWKLISGILPPLTTEQWNESFEHYKQFPQYQKLNYGMTLPEYKQIFFWEYIHRLLGRFLGILFLLPFLFFMIKRWLPKQIMGQLIFIFILGSAQGVMGWYMVKSGLSDNPHVSHFRLAAHQSLALLLIGAILLIILSIDTKKEKSQATHSFNMMVSYICLVLLFLQTILGAFVAGLKAGFSYTNFPLMGETFFPSAQLVASAPLLQNGTVLQFIHRWNGFIVILSFLLLIRVAKPFPWILKYVKMLIALGIVQLALGISTLIFYVPVTMGVAHQFVAILLFIMLVKIIYALHHVPFANIKSGEYEIS